MFRDEAKVKLGGVTVRIKRMTLKEIRSCRALWASGKDMAIDEEIGKLLKSHVTLEDGKTIDPNDLTLPQTQTLVKELVGIPEGSGISDFIGLLC